jgi:hypothetical protein
MRRYGSCIKSAKPDARALQQPSKVPPILSKAVRVQCFWAFGKRAVPNGSSVSIDLPDAEGKVIVDDAACVLVRSLIWRLGMLPRGWESGAAF